MLNTQFKEATEIPLPGKKAHEILDFLKQLYLKERDGITLNKMEHVLKLADEYQTMSVVNLCVKCLKDVPKSKVNVVKILFLANDTVIAREDDRLDSVRRECHALIKNMELADILKDNGFKNLDRDSSENVFVLRTKRLETFLKKVYPQFIGLAEFCITLCLASSPSSSITRCPEHFGSGNKANGGPL
ncbi:hypothetical protein OS493_000152 [Desmophyllum pertusum]|uniref:BTB domain-containing protein n=1 Tax=Desmophyllum pertusum TaxID=174260 RepID=A0A9X0DBE6_9CNID|nr:hypothetical protein OS493_000152 [Desmophyllum pertusum]